MFESYRGADQDVVPESPHEVEEAAHVQAEDRAKAGTVSTDVFSDHPVSSSSVLRGAFDVRCSFVGRREFWFADPTRRIFFRYGLTQHRLQLLGRSSAGRPRSAIRPSVGHCEVLDFAFPLSLFFKYYLVQVFLLEI